MSFPNAQYVNGLDGEVACIRVTYSDHLLHIPLDPANTDYAEIMRQVDEGTLTIQDADD